MKNLALLLFLIFGLQTSLGQSKKIDLKKSTLTWTGKKVTGEHQGSLKFKNGSLTFKNKKLVRGNFVVDMTSLNNTDQTGTDKAKLEGHLKSADFFDTEGYPTAQMIFKKIISKGKGLYQISADLSIKGKTNPVIFDLNLKSKSATAHLVIDRTKYGIQYGSGSFFEDLGDRTIYDEFDLDVALAF